MLSFVSVSLIPTFLGDSGLCLLLSKKAVLVFLCHSSLCYTNCFPKQAMGVDGGWETVDILGTDSITNNFDSRGIKGWFSHGYRDIIKREQKLEECSFCHCFFGNISLFHMNIQPRSTKEATSTCFLTWLSVSGIKERFKNKAKRGRWNFPVVQLKLKIPKNPWLLQLALA